MQQNVEAFWHYAFSAARPAGTDTVERAAVRLASQLIGRWPGGAPLVLSPDGERPELSDANRFSYRDLDPLGHRCPLGAHIRRGNPRDMLGSSAADSLQASSRHRIIRRGRLYGPRMSEVQLRSLDDKLLGFRPGVEEEKQERGLIFIAFNANIRRQFEFVQQTWINARQFGRLYDERDALVGADVRSYHDLMSGRDIPCARNFTLQGEPVRTRLFELPRFTRIRGGAYFFLPGRSALRYLAGAGSAQT
jgi:deferrochelatase/peroxidase EfeB